MKINKRSICLTILAALLICFCAVTASAAPAESVALTAENEPRAGETLTLIVSFTGNGRFGLSSSFRYDKAILTLESVRQLIPSPWITENSDSALLFYDGKQESPITEKTDLCALIFRVADTAETGMEISVRLYDAQTSDGAKDILLPDAVYTATIQPQRSGDASLSSLTVAGFSLTPAFSPSVRTYALTAEVPYALRELSVTAVPSNEKAKVSVSGGSLKTGNNNVKITVTAENGVQRVYMITVVLQKDPDYKESDDGRLSGINVSAGALTPLFSPDVYKYALYLPYETASVVLTGTALHPKAEANSVTLRLSGEGMTKALLSCQAENGKLTQYEVMVIVLPEYTGKPPYISNTDPEDTHQPATLPPDTLRVHPVTETLPQGTAEVPETPYPGSETDSGEKKPSGGAPWWFFILAVVVAAGGGGCGGYYLAEKHK